MREKNLIKLIQQALQKDHVYTNDELIYMKKELSNLKEQAKNKRKLTSKGFGN